MDIDVSPVYVTVT